MHQVKKLCEPDVIDLSAKKTELTALAASSVGDVATATTEADATGSDKRPVDPAASCATAVGQPDASKQQSCTVAPSSSSPRM